MYIFVINPAAGQGEAAGLTGEIRAVCEAAGIEYEIYETTGPGEAEAFVRTRCSETAGTLVGIQCSEAAETVKEETGTEIAGSMGGRCGAPEKTLRFYACGGDGTLNEVVNGAYGYSFAEVGCIPAGTGNDFIRNFPEADFMNLADQIRGQARDCDLIRYEGFCDGAFTIRYCVNMFNIGFDSNVVDLTARMKRLPLMSGTLAYLSSVATMLIRRKGADLRVEYREDDYPDGNGESGYSEESGNNGASGYNGKLLLIAVANGCFCGGGLKGLPRAVTDDGLMDVCLIKNVPRRAFVRLFPKYMKGEHLGEPRLENALIYSHERELHISPNGGEMKLCVDGEITKAGPVKFTICPKAFRFVVPAGK